MANQANIVQNGIAPPTYLVDANGNPITSTNGLPIVVQAGSSTAINDGIITSQKATVAQFHNADHQSPGGTAYGLLTGGVAQLLAVDGYLDRQTETGADGIPAKGLATGTQQLAGPAITTTFNGAVTGSVNVQTVTVASTTSMKVGDVYTTSDNVESAVVISIPSGTTITTVLKNNHGNGATLTWYHYNQARDASIGDNAALTGLSPSATYLYNNVSGVMEFDRSANGERDGASGQGTAVAAEYEYNGGGPGSGNFDRARNVQGKGYTTAAISSAATGQAVVTLSSSAPATLQQGMQVQLLGGTQESGYIASVSGTAVTLTTNIVNASHTSLAWDVFATNGPGLSGFTPIGVGIEEEALYDPVSGLFYIERSATQDGVAAANVVLENVGLWNGSTMDRQRGNLDNFVLLASGTITANNNSFDAVNYNGRGIKLYITTGAFGASESTMTVTLQGKDPVSGQYYTILQSASLTASAFTVLSVYPGLTAAANVTANDVLPRTFRVSYQATNWGTGGSVLGISCALIL